jgi:phosphoribosylanthranilate isomerase
MTHVKICGFQTAEDAAVAVQAGVDAVGLVFVPTARRRITVVQGEAIVSALRSNGLKEVVGMFADQPVEEVNMVVARLGLDAVQLCGSEGMGYCKEMRVPVYKVIAVDPSIPISAQLPKLMVLLQRHTMAGHCAVLDAKISGEYGGTGQRVDWELAADLATTGRQLVIAHDIGQVRDLLRQGEKDGTVIDVYRTVQAAVDALVSPEMGDPDEER